MRIRAVPALASFLFGAALLACGGDAGSGEAPFPPGDVALPLSALELSLNSLNQSDITDGVLDKDESIGNGSGDPWGDFLSRAVEACGGEPRGFAVQGGRLRFVERAGVTGWEELFPAEVSLSFRDTSGSDTAAVQTIVATAIAPHGTDSLPLEGRASRSALAPLHDALLGGGFHVAVRGGTDLTDDHDFSVSLGISLAVDAYCD